MKGGIKQAVCAQKVCFQHFEPISLFHSKYLGVKRFFSKLLQGRIRTMRVLLKECDFIMMVFFKFVAIMFHTGYFFLKYQIIVIANTQMLVSADFEVEFLAQWCNPRFSLTNATASLPWSDKHDLL